MGQLHGFCAMVVVYVDLSGMIYTFLLWTGPLY